MTFNDIVTEIKDQLNLRSTESTTRIGREINARYKRITSSLGIQSSRRAVSVSGSTAIGYATVTFTGIDKIDRIIDDRSGTKKILEEITFDEMREINPKAEDTPTRWAVQAMNASTVTVIFDILAQTIFTLKADGLTTASTLSGTDVPQFPEDYHDILVYGVLADEYRKAEKLKLYQDAEQMFERRLSDLRMFIAKSAYTTVRQNEVNPLFSRGTSGGGGSAPSGGSSYVQTGLITFDRDPDAPFAVTANSAKVDNLDADKLDGLDSTAFLQAVVSTDNAITRFNGIAGQVQNSGITIADGETGVLAGSNSGDVTLAGAPNYLTIAAQVITRALIDLASHVTGRLPFANITAATAASKLFGRGSAAGAGDFQEITLGTGLSMSGTTLNASSVAGADTQVQFNDGGTALGGDAGLTYDKTNDILTVGAAVKAGTNPASAGALRLANTGAIKSRNAANSGDVGVAAVNASNQLELADASTLVSLLGGQLKFPAAQNASADVNTLDDYEEGSWTPVIGGTGGQSGQTYTAQEGHYVKIGKIVIASFNVTLSTLGTVTGNAQISGLPFTAENGTLSYYFGSVGWVNLTTAYVNITARVDKNTSAVTLRAIGAAAGSSEVGTIAQADLSNNAQFLGTVMYRAA